MSLFFVFVLLVAFVDALPMRHSHIRRACAHHPPSNNVALVSATPTFTVSSSSTISPESISASAFPSSGSVVSQSTVTVASQSGSTTSTSTSTSSSAQSSQTGSSGSGTPVAKILGALFPVQQETGNSGWTTVPDVDAALPLSDSTLNPNHILSELPIDYTNAPDGKLALKAFYPEGSYTLTREPKGGLSFYAPGPDNVDLTTAKEATFGYSVMFEDGFGWQKGGKLPGLFGGNTYDGSVGCSGGSRDAACFSARLMWRENGDGELYTYLPPYTDPEFAANQAVCNIAPLSICNPTYGASVGRGAFTFAAGQWTTVSQRVRLNDVGQANGELELYVGGQSVINVGGLILRDNEEGKIRGIQMQTFFGGSEADFASPKDQSTYFSDFSVAITELL